LFKRFSIRETLQAAEEAFFYLWKYSVPAPEEIMSFPPKI